MQLRAMKLPLLLAIFSLPLAPAIGWASPLDEEAFITVANAVNPSVVTISVRQAKEFNSRSAKIFNAESSGSGFLLDSEGFLLTNRHVVEGAVAVRVMLYDKREFEAEVVNTHPLMDLALLKIKKPPHDLVPATLGDSSKLRVGEWVAAIGAPFGFTNTLTKGIVSALNRQAGIFSEKNEPLPPYTFIQTDASVNPGNSGGPLVNLKGEVVGINTLIVSPGQAGNVGLSFAIPVNAVKDALPLLRSSGHTVVLGWLGASTQELDDDLRMQLKIPRELNGLIVSSVEKDGPAAVAGLKPLDLILKAEKRIFSDALAFERFVESQPPGKEIAIEVWRRGKTFILKVKVAAKK